MDTHFTFVVVDEAHRFITPYTLALVRHFMKRKDVRVIGITATAMRDDARPLSVLFPKVAFDFTLSRRSFERQGWLARPIVTDERNIVNVKDVYKIWRKRTKGCKTIAFASTLDVARACAAYFRQKGVDACVIDASTKPADREVLETCQVIFNVGIYIEGADIPGVEAILEVNSTRSPVSFVQKAGRALRGDSKVARIIRCNPGAYSFRLK